MQRQLAAFVEQPCKATYLAARDAVLCESPLPLRTVEMAELDLGTRRQSERDRQRFFQPADIEWPVMPEQRSRAVAELRRYADEFRSLAQARR